MPINHPVLRLRHLLAALALSLTLVSPAPAASLDTLFGSDLGDFFPGREDSEAAGEEETAFSLSRPLFSDEDPLPLLPAGPKPASAAGAALPGPIGGWEMGSLTEQRIHKSSSESRGLWGSLSATTEVHDTPVPAWDDPGWKRDWKTDQNWKFSLGMLSVFGQLGAAGDEANQQNLKLNGRTGLACKVPMGLLGEYTIRSGPGVSCSDPLRPLQMHQRSDWLVEVQARWPLLFGIGLEVQSSAAPPLSPLEQNQISQDVRLAFPMGPAGKLKLGAKRQLTGLADPRPWTDTTQLYLGLELNP